MFDIITFIKLYNFHGTAHSDICKCSTRLPQHPKLLICLSNPWLVCKKGCKIHNFVIEQNIDILALTETWLNGDATDYVVINDLLPNGSNILQKSHISHGGAIAFIYKSNIIIKQATQQHLKF